MSPVHSLSVDLSRNFIITVLLFVWLWFSIPARTRRRGPDAALHAHFQFPWPRRRLRRGRRRARPGGRGLRALLRHPVDIARRGAPSRRRTLPCFVPVDLDVLSRQTYKRYVLSMKPRWEAEDEQAAAAIDQQIQAALKGLGARWKVERREDNEAAVGLKTTPR